MTYSQKYALVHFIPQVKDGTPFHMSDWPLHVTLADVFAIDRHGTDIDTKLAAMLAQSNAVTVNVLDDGILGTTPVVLLDRAPSLIRLHTTIISLLEENGATFNTPAFTRNGFLPHSTVQKSGRLHARDIVTIDSISLIDMFPGGDWKQRKVLARFSMKTHD